MNSTFLVDYQTIDQTKRMKLKASDETDANSKAHGYLKGKYVEFYTILKVVEIQEKPLPERIAEYVINHESVRTDCETEKEAEDLAKQIEAEFKKRGFENDFWCWVFGTAVHSFPVYYELPGSINHKERLQREAQEKQKGDQQASRESIRKAG